MGVHGGPFGSTRFGACGPRPVRFLELWATDGWRLKVYSIAHGRERARAELVDAGRAVARRWLLERPTRHTHHGVGFLGVHDGRGENQVFLDVWINENELMHVYWCSPTDDPTSLSRPGEDHNSVCVWDLAVQAFEREAWLACVLRNPSGPDLEGYLAARMHADV